METIKNVVQLRQLLAERFPATKILGRSNQSPSPALWPTGLSSIDLPLGGGLPKGGIIEITVAKPGSGGGVILRRILQQVHETGQWAALVDGQDTFDPASSSMEVLSHLLWVRCQTADQALKTTDLLVRDGNLPLVVLDLQLNPLVQLRRIPSTLWYRLQRLLEQSKVALLVLSPRAQVNSAAGRFNLPGPGPFTLEALMQPEDLLFSRLKIQFVPRRAWTLPESEEPLVAAQAG